MKTRTRRHRSGADAPPETCARRAYEVLASGAAQILPADGLAERLLAAKREQRPLRVKLGIDPSGSDLTLGHAVVLRKLRQFQDFGHTAVLVVGGFTGQVGDPSGRTATRVAQSADQVDRERQGLLRPADADPRPRSHRGRQQRRLARPDAGVAEILGYTRQMTVAQLLERDDFARRFAAQQPITLSEFFYPLLQGIDSVEIRADIELGGTDQTFNNLVGRELQRSRGQAPQVVLTVPLLVGTDGVEKMGKSLDNYIAINDSADEQFGKLMSIPDAVVGMYARLCTACIRARSTNSRRHVECGRQPRPTWPSARSPARSSRCTTAREAAAGRRGALRRDLQARRGARPMRPNSRCPTAIRCTCPALLVAAGLAREHERRPPRSSTTARCASTAPPSRPSSTTSRAGGARRRVSWRSASAGRSASSGTDDAARGVIPRRCTR